MTLAVVIAANLLVGLLIGISGIAGFLLPMIYLGVLRFSPENALALSFTAFLVSGLMGAAAHYKAGTLSVANAWPTAVACLAGSIIGVGIGNFVPEYYLKLLLYLTVLLSGLSLTRQPKGQNKTGRPANIGRLWPVFIPIGAVCALTGSGGPILIIPFLVAMGVPLQAAIATGIFDSIFIALPAVGGYLARSTLEHLVLLVVVVCACQVAGTWMGTRISGKIDHTILKKAIAVIVIVFSLWMLVKLLFL